MPTLWITEATAFLSFHRLLSQEWSQPQAWGNILFSEAEEEKSSRRSGIPPSPDGKSQPASLQVTFPSKSFRRHRFTPAAVTFEKMVPFERSSLFLSNLSSKDFMTKNSKKETRWKYLQCIRYRYTSLWNVLSYIHFFKQANNSQRMKCFSWAGALCMYTLTEFLPRLWVTCYSILQTWKLRCSYLSEIICLADERDRCGTQVAPDHLRSCLLWTVTQQKKRSWREEKCHPQSEASREGTETLFWVLSLKQSSACESQSYALVCALGVCSLSEERLAPGTKHVGVFFFLIF